MKIPDLFVAVAEWLASVGLSAPQILARDLDKGLLLLGDFGDWRLREFLDSDPQRERELYELATDVLIHLHRHKPMPGLMSHGLQQWLTELELFTEWYCPAVGADVDLPGYRSAWLQVLEPVAKDGLGPVTVLRDYHAENIMLVNDRQGWSISACSTSRTRLPVILLTISHPFWRTPAATSLRKSSGR